MERKSVLMSLRLLVIVQILSLASSVLLRVIPLGAAVRFVPLLFDALTLYCLVKMRGEHRLYRIAVWFHGLNFISSLLELITADLVIVSYLYRVFGESIMDISRVVSTVMTYATLVLSWLAIYFEYTAHSKLASAVNPILAMKWQVIAIASIAILLCASIAGSILMAMIENDVLSILAYQQLIYPILRLIPVLTQIAYILCLLYTWRALSKEQKGDIENFNAT